MSGKLHHSAAELPKLSKLRVECVLREHYHKAGPAALECSVYEDVRDGEENLFDRWAAETVVRCWPVLADDKDIVAALKRGGA